MRGTPTRTLHHKIRHNALQEVHGSHYLLQLLRPLLLKCLLGCLQRHVQLPPLQQGPCLQHHASLSHQMMNAQSTRCFLLLVHKQHLKSRCHQYGCVCSPHTAAKAFMQLSALLPNMTQIQVCIQMQGCVYQKGYALTSAFKQAMHAVLQHAIRRWTGLQH